MTHFEVGLYSWRFTVFSHKFFYKFRSLKNFHCNSKLLHSFIHSLSKIFSHLWISRCAKFLFFAYRTTRLPIHGRGNFSKEHTMSLSAFHLLQHHIRFASATKSCDLYAKYINKWKRATDQHFLLQCCDSRCLL